MQDTPKRPQLMDYLRSGGQLADSSQATQGPSQTNRKAITTERQLYTWLVRAIKTAEPRQMYNSALVDFAQFLIKEIPDGFDLRDLNQYIPTGGPILAYVFEQMNSTETRRECSSALIAVASKLYEEICNDFVNLEHANRIAIHVLDLGAPADEGTGYFEQVKRGDNWWLISTKAFEEQSGRTVEIKQTMCFFGYI